MKYESSTPDIGVGKLLTSSMGVGKSSILGIGVGKFSTRGVGIGKPPIPGICPNIGQGEFLGSRKVRGSTGKVVVSDIMPAGLDK